MKSGGEKGEPEGAAGAGQERSSTQGIGQVQPAESIYRGRVVHLTVEEIRLPNGLTARLEIVRHPGAAAVVALDEAGLVVLLRQYRHATGGLLLEVPAGTLKKGEDPSRCAYRELLEETGLKAAKLVPLGEIFTCPGFCDEKIHLFLATGLKPGCRSLDADEVIEEVKRVRMEEALQMIDSGVICDAKSIAAIHLASRRVGLRG